MSAKVYFIKRVKDCKMKLTLFVYCNYLVLLSTPLCSQNINKQIVNIADENLTDYSFFFSRYHYTKSKNYFKRRYRICHWTPMFIETPCPKSNKLDGWQIKDKRLLIFVKQLLIKHWFSIEYKQFLSIMLQPFNFCCQINEFLFRNLSLETLDLLVLWSDRNFVWYSNVKRIKTEKWVI